jgi:hypothetical protein
VVAERLAEDGGEAGGDLPLARRAHARALLCARGRVDAREKGDER